MLALPPPGKGAVDSGNRRVDGNGQWKWGVAPIPFLRGVPDAEGPLFGAAFDIAIDRVVKTFCGWCEWTWESFTDRPPTAHPLGRAKLEIARRFARSRRGPRAGGAACADSSRDIPLLAYDKRAVAVDPDRKLRRTARSHGWDIIE